MFVVFILCLAYLSSRLLFSCVSIVFICVCCSFLGSQGAGRASQVRGKGLLNAVVINERDGVTAHNVCLALMERGVLAKPTHGNIVRLAPPLVMTEEQLLEAADIFRDAVLSFDRP